MRLFSTLGACDCGLCCPAKAREARFCSDHCRKSMSPESMEAPVEDVNTFYLFVRRPIGGNPRNSIWR